MVRWCEVFQVFGSGKARGVVLLIRRGGMEVESDEMDVEKYDCRED